MYGTGTSFLSPGFNSGARRPNVGNGVTLRDGQGEDRSTFRAGVTMNRGVSEYSPVGSFGATPPPVGVTVSRGAATDYSPMDLGSNSPNPRKASDEPSLSHVTTKRGAAAGCSPINAGSEAGAATDCSGVPLSGLRETMAPKDTYSETSSQEEYFPVRNLEKDYSPIKNQETQAAAASAQQGSAASDLDVHLRVCCHIS